MQQLSNSQQATPSLPIGSQSFQRASRVGLVARGEPGDWWTHKVQPVPLGNGKSAAFTYVNQEQLLDVPGAVLGAGGYQAIYRM